MLGITKNPYTTLLLNRRRRLVGGLLVLFSFLKATPLSGQDLPSTIRGYKVHHEIITISNKQNGSSRGPKAVIGVPTVSDISLSGISLSVMSELEEAGRNARVEMMTFHDFRVNGYSVEVADITIPFPVNRIGRTKLPQPATVRLPTLHLMGAAWEELTASKEEWKVTGRVFVFGRFKKFGFSFKRVVPIDVDLVIRNPLLEYKDRAPSGK